MSRDAEKAALESLKRVATDPEDVDLYELRLVLERFENIDIALEAHRCATFIAKKGETLTMPVRYFEKWLGNARPLPSKDENKGRKVLGEMGIAAKLDSHRKLLARCVEWEGTRATGLTLVPSFTPTQIEEECQELESRLRERVG